MKGVGSDNGIPARTEVVRERAPMVSVVIPAYNAAPYIAATLDSVFAQTLSGSEVFVVNDGSPDTSALELALQPYRSRIQYIRQENRGPSGARNAALRAASGKYIAFLDSDDLWLPTHLSAQVSFLEANSIYQLVYANGIYLRGDVPVGILFDTNVQSMPTDFEGLLHERSTVITSSTVVLRQALMQVGLFDEQLRRCEDYDLWLRLSHAGVGFSFTRKIHICHRLANGLAGDGELMKRALIQVYEKHLALGTLTEQQAQFVRKKIHNIYAAIEYQRAKRALLGGEFPEALESMLKAQTTVSSWRLAIARFGLRRFPHVLQTLYRLHLRRVERQYRARSSRSLKNVGFHGIVGATKNLADQDLSLGDRSRC